MSLFPQFTKLYTYFILLTFSCKSAAQNLNISSSLLCISELPLMYLSDSQALDGGISRSLSFTQCPQGCCAKNEEFQGIM